LFGGGKTGLPPALEEAIKVQKKAGPALPIVDLPTTVSNAHHSNGV
jgi:hypothetical protein